MFLAMRSWAPTEPGSYAAGAGCFLRYSACRVECMTKPTSSKGKLIGVAIGVVFATMVVAVVGAKALALRLLFVALGVLLASTWLYGKYSKAASPEVRRLVPHHVPVWGTAFVLILGGWLGFKGAGIEAQQPEQGHQQPGADSAHQQQAATPAAKATAPPGVNCKALLEDIDWLRAAKKRVQARSYRPTKSNCDATTKEVNARFGADWNQTRRVTPVAEAGEPKLMDAARTFGASDTEIVLAFACDGASKLQRDHGAEIVQAYDRDFDRHTKRLAALCGGKDPDAEEQAAARRTFDKKRGNNAEAASTAEGLIKLLGSQAKGLDIFVKLEGDEAGFGRGMPLKDYRASVKDCRMMVVANAAMWAATAAGSQKDLVAQFVNALKKLYPSCLPYVLVNNGARDVAVGSWSAWNKAPDVELK